MLLRSLLLAFFCSKLAAAQPYYTPVRGAFGGDLYGIAPKAGISAEASFGYLKKSHWNVQTGLGAITRWDFRSPSLSAALTRCFILNPYKRRPCVPQPGNHLIEGFLEVGLGGFVIDRYDNAVYSGTNKQRLLTPSGIIGLRLNIVTGRWIYIFKLRYTPSVLPNSLASRAGMGVALGWR